MGRIIDAIRKAYSEGKTTVSFEFFPAKTEEGIDNLLMRIEDMSEAYQPTFVTLTWRSAFADESLWLKIGATVQKEFKMDCLLHLTCHLPVTDLKRILKRCREAGIQNILALRGDPPIGQEKWVPSEGGLSNAGELVKLIREEHGDYFCIAVAAYPEVHTECWNNPDLPPSEQSAQLDLDRLKVKVDAGADFIITQFFYDVDIFLKFKEKCRAYGIRVPILPGYLPIQSYQAFKKFSGWCKTRIPRHIRDGLEAVKEDDERVKAFGVKEAVAANRRLLDTAAATSEKSIHLYTMNLAQAAGQVLDALGLTPLEQKSKHPLNWRRRTGGEGKSDKGGVLGEVRPIYWSNRQSSYVMRTTGWDEFPNGRWGDSRSPAYGELSGYYIAYKRPKVNRVSIWGQPTCEEEVYFCFVRFVDGQLDLLPWCEQSGVAKETTLIQSNLKFLNENGFLTINSQPRVDGVPSEDPDVGWGPPGGFVYQKAYIEFFCSPEKLQQLIEHFPHYPSLTYHAINCHGLEHTNNTHALANAVTWGVFPSAEILQPTVVDPASFRIWKDEAFELWMSQWASAYNSPSQEDKTAKATIEKIHNTYFLVSVVDNDYSDSGDIFAVFRDIITNGMEKLQLRLRVRALETEVDTLHSTISDLRKQQHKAAEELRRLQEQTPVHKEKIRAN